MVPTFASGFIGFMDQYDCSSFLYCNTKLGLCDHSRLVSASELLQPADLQGGLDDWTKCLLGIQSMLAGIITILLNVHPEGSKQWSTQHEYVGSKEMRLNKKAT